MQPNYNGYVQDVEKARKNRLYREEFEEQMRLNQTITAEAQALYFAAAKFGVTAELLTPAEIAAYDPTLNTRRVLQTLPPAEQAMDKDWQDEQATRESERPR